ncbi:coiled coil [Cryptosporidium sp. chipmunk genotype I]|uniref:coiled coil n=1 Tax=Cryptosporidium sp. chipmunk genotype I TaxID=1280935 RepID=UPI003519F720|nr:coiled coil [Cryptosporidium sp. chipmunk genotype I]
MKNETSRLINSYIRNTFSFYQFQVVKAQYDEDNNSDQLSSLENISYKLIEAQEKVNERYQLLLKNNKFNQAINDFRLFGKERLLTILETLGLELTENGIINIPNHLLVDKQYGSNPGAANSLTFNTTDDNNFLRTLKRKIKQELKKFDSDFQMLYGKLPSKSDKEPLKPLYILYRNLKDSTYQAKDSHIQDLTSELESLKQKKNQLRELLETFQNQFLKKNHRKVLYHKDLLPIEKEYLEYKSIKNKIKQLEDIYSNQR